jgi:uncharacterized membrane protein
MLGMETTQPKSSQGFRVLLALGLTMLIFAAFRQRPLLAVGGVALVIVGIRAQRVAAKKDSPSAH